jgi:hypothetical protein
VAQTATQPKTRQKLWLRINRSDFRDDIASLCLQGYPQRIKEWFNNHTRESYRAGKNQTILNLTVKKAKLLPLHQAYSQLHYDTRIKEVVRTEWSPERARILEQKANGEDVKDPPETAPLWFRNKIIKSEFDAETDEVKGQVEKYRQSLLDGSGGEPLDAGVDAEEAKHIAMALARAK